MTGRVAIVWLWFVALMWRVHTPERLEQALAKQYQLRAYVGRYSKGSMSYATACTLPYPELRRYSRAIHNLLEDEHRKSGAT